MHNEVGTCAEILPHCLVYVCTLYTCIYFLNLESTLCSWKNNILKINMFIQLEVYISIQEFSLFAGEQSFSVYTK